MPPERRRTDSGKRDPGPAIHITFSATSAVMREYVLFTKLRPQGDAIKEERLVGEWTDLFCSYLRIQE